MNTDLIKQRFSKAQHTYSQNSSMQQFSADHLFDLICQRGIESQKILEIGAGTGYLTSILRENYPLAKYIANDIVQSLCSTYTNMGCECAMGDITKIELPDSIDLVASSSCFQWIEGLDVFLKNLSAKMTENGLLAFSSFGTEHFSQLKDISGHGLHYHPIETLKKFIGEAGFSNVCIEESTDTLYFATALDMLKYFSATGVNAIHRELWTPNKLLRFEQRYREEFPTETDLLPLNVHYIWAIGNKK